MSVNLSLLAGAGWQFFTDDGVPLAGGLLYTYAAGTTTPQATYTSSSGSTAHANPIVLNSAGRVAAGEVWLTNGYSYKFLLQNASNVQIASYDNIPGFSSNLPIINDASSIAYEQGFTVTAGSFVVGNIYLITSVGTTNFIAIGASANTVGVHFTATGAGSGTGTAQLSRTVQVKLQESVSVKDFGALGNDNQTLFATSYLTDISKVTTITQQTADGIAINKAIVYLRSIGGGELYFPKGTYCSYAYLEPIDFPCHIYGDGIDLTIIKNCDTSPTNTNGYGIFICQGTGASAIALAFNDLTLDGNAVVRTLPTGEFRSYPISFYGKVNGKVTRIKSINSPIDCFLTAYENAVTSSMQVSDCTFDNSFRNTMSLVAGWNQTFVNCSISGGGQVQGGTNPKYCLDIEPDSVANPIEKIAFSNCHFFNAVNVIAGGIWCEALFSNCTFDAYGSSLVGYPWVFSFGSCQVELTGCKFNGKDGELANKASHYYNISVGAFQYSQYLKIIGCSFYGCGFQGVGVRSLLKDCLFMNSLYPVIYESGSTGRHEVTVENLTLINVIDGSNVGAGAYASFAVKSNTEGPVIIDGLNVIIDPDNLPTSPSFTISVVHGIYLSSGGLATAEMKVSNVQSSGFYQKYPDATSQTQNASNFRDWGSPNLPQPNTAGQTAGPGVIYYANCTMYGNSP